MRLDPSNPSHEGVCIRARSLARRETPLLVGMLTSPVLEDCLQLLAVRAGPVDRQLGDRLADRGRQSAGGLHRVPGRLAGPQRVARIASGFWPFGLVQS